MLFGFNKKGRFVRLDKATLPGNDIEWVHIFNQLDLQDRLGGVAINAHPAREFVPKATDVFLRQAIRQYPIRIPAPKRRKNPAGGVVRTRLLVESKTADRRGQDCRDQASRRRDPQADCGTILDFLTELNCDGANGACIEYVNDRSEHPSAFRTLSSANAMLNCSAVGRSEFRLDEV